MKKEKSREIDNKLLYVNRQETFGFSVDYLTVSDGN